MGHLANDMNAYVMGFFLSLSIINVWENTHTFFTRRKKLDALQWVSSISQITNLILHLVLNTALYLPCAYMVGIETFFFYVLQIGSGYVIIYRATAIITNRRRRILIRSGLALLQVISIGLNLASEILMEIHVVEGTCIPIYQRQFNDICKIFLAILYIGLLIAFIVPIVQSIKKSTQYFNKSTLKDVAIITAVKIIFAIMVQLITVILSLIGVFGEYFWIQFTLQNYAIIWASTIASRKTVKESDSGIILTSPTRRAVNSRATSSKGFAQIDSQSV